ncbi:MAG: 16S rRNA (cytosine(967)-C(5))-methyltransferase RsmB [Candidatus Marinimicrobia bacterium]|nr:16S rRNA (cytosine(967)-C(5))-methyltransferase RsmB [Candidatus Neomarinimicrobiota bacterium]
MPVSKKVLRPRRLAWQIIYKALDRDRRLSDITLELLSKTNFTDREKRFTVELVQGTIRMRGRLDYELKKVYNNDWDELLLKVKVLLWLGAYQMKFMDGIPPYAAVSTSVTLAKAIHINTAGLVNAILRIYSSVCDEQMDEPEDETEWAEYMSHPDWLVRKWSLFWSREEVRDMCEWDNEKPTIWFRLNNTQMSIEERDEFLKENEFEFKTWEHDDRFFHVHHTSRLLNNPIFDEGKISIQDPAGGLVVKLLDPQKREIITDSCAAPGGKTSFISQLMENTGKIRAYDSHMARLKKFAFGMARLKVNNVDAEMADMTTKKLTRSGKMLVDVPCTGTGVMSKRADLRWRRTIKNLYELVQIQRDILFNVGDYIKKEGVLVYSTCSLEPEENWGVIDHFMKLNPNWEVESAEKYVPKEYVDERGALYTFPPKHGIDGGFAVRLIKK